MILLIRNISFVYEIEMSLFHNESACLMYICFYMVEIHNNPSHDFKITGVCFFPLDSQITDTDCSRSSLHHELFTQSKSK